MQNCCVFVLTAYLRYIFFFSPEHSALHKECI